jgi:hypothetical protein
VYEKDLCIGLDNSNVEEKKAEIIRQLESLIFLENDYFAIFDSDK